MCGLENCVHLFQLHLNSSVGDLALSSLSQARTQHAQHFMEAGISQDSEERH